MGCLKLTYKRNNDTLKVAYSLYRENQKYCTGSYRYGFNGKENDPETVGTGSGTQDYGMRIYNPSLGKFLSVDPLGKDYAYYTPYQFAGNKPIAAIDLDGLEDVFIVVQKDKTETMQIVYTSSQIKALIKGTPVSFKVYYNGDKKGTTQFEGPNKQNEKQIFSIKSIDLNGEICKIVEKPKVIDGSSKSIIYLVPKPAIIKKEIFDNHDIIDNSAGGIAIWGDFLGERVAGIDYKGAPAGMGAIVSGDMSKQLDVIADKIKKNVAIKEININFTYSKSKDANFIPVQQSIINGLDNVMKYLQEKGVKVNITTSYQILNEDKGASNKLDVEYKK